MIRRFSSTASSVLWEAPSTAANRSPAVPHTSMFGHPSCKALSRTRSHALFLQQAARYLVWPECQHGSFHDLPRTTINQSMHPCACVSLAAPIFRALFPSATILNAILHHAYTNQPRHLLVGRHLGAWKVEKVHSTPVRPRGNCGPDAGYLTFSTHCCRRGMLASSKA